MYPDMTGSITRSYPGLAAAARTRIVRSLRAVTDSRYLGRVQTDDQVRTEVLQTLPAPP